MVDKNSLTWIEVKRFVESEHNKAVSALIQDKQSERQRGKIDLLSRLLKLADPQQPTVVITDDYK